MPVRPSEPDPFSPTDHRDPGLVAVLPLRNLAGLRLGWRAACSACGWTHTRLDHPEEEGVRLIVEALADAHADDHQAP